MDLADAMDDAGDAGYAGRRVLVTGATGFIGSRLVEALRRRSATVRVLRRPSSRLPMAWTDVESCSGDLEDPASLARAVETMDTVFHAAGFAHAEDRSGTAQRHERINAEGTRSLLEAAARAGVQGFVFLSSVLAMGPGGERCLDEEWPRLPQSPYGRAKRAAEQAVLDMGTRYARHAVNLRLALVYGRGVKGNLRRLLKLARIRGLPALPEGGKRSLVHVEDVVRAALLAANCPAARHQTYIVTDGRAYSSREIMDLARRALGKPPPAWRIPLPVLRWTARLGDAGLKLTGRRIGFDGEALDKLLGWGWYCSEKIQRELSFKPRYDLAESLPDMLLGDGGTD
ncbi:MAG: NAD-dependent epimerase/dehydratase family protein [Gammaproteobacteria bacterium]|nr:NAD-dependent epimerase/dehydratase family protein [Gammaproteobacteria bacterium]MCP5424046.1 NAD-dependent epimerase/dehydratase family protein [Gammaproteobacteria bacterium]MCP5459520.1 NAD-dependent epimerase/dehydratase family protein [Gammaproteobacteria bacterium]